MIDVSVVHWLMARARLDVRAGTPGATGDTLYGHRYLHEVYARAIPALYRPRDRAGALGPASGGRSSTTSSSEIIRMLNAAFDGVGALPGDYYPAALRAEIDAVNERVYATVNNGVYRAGLRHHPGGLRRGGRRAVRDAWTGSRSACSRATLPRRRPRHRGRLAAVHHAAALRPGLSRPLQVQPAPARRLPEPVGLHARAVPVAGRRRDGRLRAHQGPLLRQPLAPSTRPASCPRGRCSI